MSVGFASSFAPAFTACWNAASQSFTYSHIVTGTGLDASGAGRLMPGISSFTYTTESPILSSACQTDLPSGAFMRETSCAPSAFL